MHKEWNYVRKVILTHEKQSLKKSHFWADKLLRPTLSLVQKEGPQLLL